MKPKCLDLRTALPGWRVAPSPDHERGSRIDPWNLEIRGRYGWIRPHGGELLQAYTDRAGVRRRLRELGVLHQEGSDETVILIRVDDTGPVLELLQCYRRRIVTPEERERLAALLVCARKTGVHGGRKALAVTNATPSPSALPEAATGLLGAKEGTR